MKVALLFPGQGAQYVGMGKALYDYDTDTQFIFNEANQILDWDVKEVCFEDSNGLINQTRYTQAALFVTNYGIYKALQKEGIKADAMLGFSLGEYNAILASGILNFKETLTLVDQRASFMEACAMKYPGGMSAVVGMPTHQIATICEEVSQITNSSVTVANDNCEGQVTIAGTQGALELAAQKLKDAGAKRVIPLKVSGAFHSPFMQEAATKLAESVALLDFKQSKTPIVSNVTARFIEAKEVKANIPRQVISGVRFRESVLYLLAQGFDTFIEVGPKCTLSNLVKKISNEVTTIHVEDVETLKAASQKVGVGNA